MTRAQRCNPDPNPRQAGPNTRQESHLGESPARACGDTNAKARSGEDAGEGGNGEHCSLNAPCRVLREHGLRCTRQRRLIYEALAAAHSHPTAEDLAGMVRRTDPGVSLATVYNALEAFSDRGLCRKLPGQGENGASRYDPDCSPHVHVTLDSGEIIDVPDDLGGELLERIGQDDLERLGRALGVKITGVRLGLEGERGR